MHPRDLRIEDYTYLLPEERIAHYPLAQRDASRLLLYRNGIITEDIYRHLPAHVPAGALMVFNQTRVVNARLLFRKPTGGGIEVFCLAPGSSYADVQSAMLQRGSVQWECMVGGAAKWKEGMTIALTHTGNPGFTLQARIVARQPSSFLLQLDWDDQTLTFAEVLHYAGKVPLPPYLNRDADAADETTYQTTYAREDGSVAAPTAGLHFTDHIFEGLKARAIDTTFVTLHVGAGTFRPVKAGTMAGHDMHAEWIAVDMATIQALLAHAAAPVVAVGTTSLRTLESLYWLGAKLVLQLPVHWHGIAVSQWDPYELPGHVPAAAALQALLQYMQAADIERLTTRTQILIAPGYRFRIIAGLVTNFHQPASTLLLLVAALAGPGWRTMYSYALQHGFRFLSYGDGALIWNADSGQ